MERIVLGSGKIYIKEFTESIPEDNQIEQDENLLGLIQGGASLTYTPTFYEAKDDFNIVSKKSCVIYSLPSSPNRTWNTISFFGDSMDFFLVSSFFTIN